MAEIHDEVLHGEKLLAEKRRQRQTHTANDGQPSAGPTLRDQMVEGTCRVCGQLMATLPGIEPICPECNVKNEWAKLRRGMVEANLREAGLLNGEPAHMHLKTWRQDSPMQKRAYEVVTNWLSDWGVHMLFDPLEGFRDSVLLWSKSPGTGKTHLARAVQRQVIISGGFAVFSPMNELLDEIRQSYDDRELQTHTIMYRLKNAGLLIFDDLGKEYVSEKGRRWLRDVFWNVIRYRHEKGKPLFITSNSDPAEVSATLGPYSSSRIDEMIEDRVVDMSGADWRMRQGGDS